MRPARAVNRHTTRCNSADSGCGRRPDRPGRLGMVRRGSRRARCPIVDTWWSRDRRRCSFHRCPARRPEARLEQAQAVFRHPSRRWPCPPASRDRSACAGHLCFADSGRARCAPSMASITLHDHLLHDLSRQIFHRRRLPPRRGRLLLDHRPGRRCHQRLRPPSRHGGSESALVAHAKVAEAAVVGYPHDIKGQGIYAYVT